MKRAEHNSSTDKRSSGTDFGAVRDESPRLPGFRSWRAVYWLVVGCFVFYVVFLALFSRAFS